MQHRFDEPLPSAGAGPRLRSIMNSDTITIRISRAPYIQPRVQAHLASRQKWQLVHTTGRCGAVTRPAIGAHGPRLLRSRFSNETIIPQTPLGLARTPRAYLRVDPPQ